MTTEWRPVVGWERYYEVSSCGRVRSVGRVLSYRDGRKRWLPVREKSVFDQGRGHLAVWLLRDGTRLRRYVHHVVLEAFVGPRPEGHEGCHKDGDPANNHVSNLYWGTRAENVQDMIRHGTHRKFITECKHGHPFTPENTRIAKRGGRICRECDRRARRDWYRRKRATALPPEPESRWQQDTEAGAIG